MSKDAFDKIAEGLNEALALSREERCAPMVEKVAMAIKDNVSAGLPAGVTVDWRYAAVAAIEAMRDPSHDMMMATFEAMFEEKYTGAEAPMIGAGWEAGIDAALKEE